MERFRPARLEPQSVARRGKSKTIGEMRRGFIEVAVLEQGYQASEVASLLGCPASNVSGELQRQGAQNLSMNRTQTPVQTDPYIVGAMHVC